MSGRTDHGITEPRRIDEEHTADCQRSLGYSLRKQQQDQVKFKHDIEDAVFYINKGKDKKGFVVKTVSKEIGKGVFAEQDFGPGSFLLEYDGELVKAAEGRKREKTYPLQLGSYIYFFQHKSRRFCLDGTFSKRKGRYINDGIGKEQNSVMKMIELNNRPYLAVFATRKIMKGEEIRYDYGVANLPWRSKTIHKKKENTDDGSCKDEKETITTIKECRVELERLSFKTIKEKIIGFKNQIGSFLKTGQMETVTVEGISKTSVDQHQMFEISKCGTNAEHENNDERIDSEEPADVTPGMPELFNEVPYNPLFEEKTDVKETNPVVIVADNNVETENDHNVATVINLSVQRETSHDVHTEINQTVETEANHSVQTEPHHSVQAEANHSVQTEANHSVQTEANYSVQTEPNHSVQTEANHSVQTEANHSVQTEANYSVQTEPNHSVQTEANHSVQTEANYSVQTEANHSVQTEANYSVQTETNHSVQTETNHSVQTEANYSVQTEPNHSVQTEANHSVQTETNHSVEKETNYSVETETNHSVQTEANYSVQTEANHSVQTEANHSVQTETNHSVQTETNHSVQTEANYSVQTDPNHSVQTEANYSVETETNDSVETETNHSVETETNYSVETETNHSVETETNYSVETETNQSVEKEAKHSVQTEPNHSVQTEPNHIVQTEANHSAQTEPNHSVQTEADQSVETEANHSVETETNYSVETETNYSVETDTNYCMETATNQSVETETIHSEETETNISMQAQVYHFMETETNHSEETETEETELCVETENTTEMVKSTASTNVSKHTKAKVAPKKIKDCRPKRPCPFCGKFFRRLTKHLQTKVHRNEMAVKQAMSARKQEKDNYFTELKRIGYNKMNIELLKESSTSEVELISEKKSKNKKLAICSFCKGAFTVPYISRHKRICHIAEGTTMPPITIPVSLLAEPIQDPLFVEQILAKFRDDEAGNVCRTDDFLKKYGTQRFRKFKTRVDKKQEVRTSVMCEMRRLATLYLAFKEEAKKYNFYPESVVDLLNRKHFQILADAVDTCSTSEGGTQKSGLKRALGYILKLAGKFRKGFLLQQGNDEDARDADYFLILLTHNWIDMFDDAEYNCKKARQLELRRPKRLPNENDIRKLRDVTLTEIKRLTADEYKIMSTNDFVRLRNLVVSRLTMFNARRGGEPGRLEITEWDDAKAGAWLDKNRIKTFTDPLEKNILGRFYLAYQSGKNVSQLVPLLIPEDCWTAVLILVDPGVRDAAGVNKNNIYVFPRVYNSLRHVSGWYCTESACQIAELDTVVTATVMRHRASTFYAALDVSDNDREAFYRHMGHSEEINKNVYQCPMGIKEITSVGKFLEDIEGALPAQSQEENEEMDDQQEIENMMQPSNYTATEGTSSQTDTNRQIEEFLKQLVDENVMDRALSGNGLIEEEDVEVIPEKLYPYHHIILSHRVQREAKCYFNEDAWLTAQNTFLMLQDLVETKAKEKGQKRKHGESDSDSDENWTDEDDFKLNEDGFSSSEDDEKLKFSSKRKKITKKTTKVKECIQNKQTEMKPMKKKVERSYYQWNEHDSKILVDYFKQEISDTESKKYPGSAAIKQFLKSNPSILQHVPESQKTLKIKTKIFNERSKIKARLSKTYDKMVI